MIVRLGKSCQVRLGQVRLGQVRLGQVRLGQVRLGQVRLGQVRLGQVRLGQVRLDQVRLGQVRLSQVWLGLFYPLQALKQTNLLKNTFISNCFSLLLLESAILSSVVVIAAHAGQKSDLISVVEGMGESLVKVVLPSLPLPSNTVIVYDKKNNISTLFQPFSNIERYC